MFLACKNNVSKHRRNANDVDDAANDSRYKEMHELLKAAFSLRMQKATQQLTNSSEIRKVRRDIARVKTVLAKKVSANV